MKKITIGFVIYWMYSMILLSTDKQNPFESFMGVQWGTNAVEFQYKIEFEVGEIGPKGSFFYPKTSPARDEIEYNEIENIRDGFYTSDFKLGNLVVEIVMFGFEPNENDLAFKRKNYDRFKFTNAILIFERESYDSMLGILKKKYGESESIGTKIKWKNGDRMITLYQHAKRDKNVSMVLFDRNDEDKAVDIL